MDIYNSSIRDQTYVSFDALKEGNHRPYKKEGILLPFKNHENNKSPDNYVHGAFPYCRTDNRMLKATKTCLLIPSKPENAFSAQI